MPMPICLWLWLSQRKEIGSVKASNKYYKHVRGQLCLKCMPRANSSLREISRICARVATLFLVLLHVLPFVFPFFFSLNCASSLMSGCNTKAYLILSASLSADSPTPCMAPLEGDREKHRVAYTRCHQENR